jgi:hypothetical protein
MDDTSREYFIENKLPLSKVTLKDLEGSREESISVYLDNLKPLIEHLKNNKFIDGEKPLIHDYLLISTIQLVKSLSPRTYVELIEENPSEVFKNWVKSMSGLFNGFLNNRKTVLSE